MNVRSNNAWVDVMDALPPPDTKVLCLDLSAEEYFDAKHKRTTGWHHDNTRVYVTHWCQLPELPC